MGAPGLPGGGRVGAERKLVTVLVCEVHGPIEHSDQPRLEDSGVPPAGSLTRVQAEVARHGGLVVEVLGDTVVAVFGVPRTHDDDAERAVRAALALRAAFPGSATGGWRVRAGVASGEALVRVGEGSGGRGWGIAGAVVAAAMAVKDAAPLGAVLVTAVTLQATQRAISYAPVRMLRLAGGKEVAVWDALAPRPRSGRLPPPVLGVELVGRDGELAVLLDRYHHIRVGGGPQLVTLVGPAGIGKSRLLAELGHRLASGPDAPTWRAGRAQPHGDAAPFGALVEIAKAEAGILDGDQATTADRKLTDTIARVLPGSTTAWVARQLRPLIGASTTAATEADGGVERAADVVAAWRWLLRALADRRPLVLAVEDLHWADHLLLDVLEGLVDPVLADSAPMLVVATARPELLDRRPGWDQPQPNRTTVHLGPLATVETRRLLQALLTQHGVTAAIEPDLLARVNGNPLFAEEYARLLRDQPNRTGVLPVPTTVQGVIAARLDALPPEVKAVMANAAVLGQVAWVGAIAALAGDDPADVNAWLELNHRLGELERRELLRRAAGSRVAGEVEVAFRHVLVRDVAYAQLPRAARADRHQRAAAWLEQLAPDRTADRAELLAYHYTQALTYAQATEQPTAWLIDQARHALCAAGDHAIALGTHVTAARYYTQALALWPDADPERAELELRAGEARCYGEGTGEDLLVKARDGLLAAGARERAAEAEVLLGRLAYVHGQPRETHFERAVDLVADAPPSRSKLAVLNGCMHHLTIAGRHTEAHAVARQALVMANTIGGRDVAAAALGVIGAARITQGDRGGLAELERCVALFEELNSSHAIGWQINLAYSRSMLGDLRGSIVAREAAWRAAERFGALEDLRHIELERVAEHYWTGRWDQAQRVADSAVADAAAGARRYMECECRVWRGRIHLTRGEVAAALEDGERALELARESGDPQNLDPALAFCARVLLAADRHAKAAELVDELLAGLPGRMLNPNLGVDLAVDLVQLGRPSGALEQVRPSPWLAAARALIAGDPEQAAKTYAVIGSRPDEAYARIQAARRLLAAGHAAEADAELVIAAAFYRDVGVSADLAQ